MSKATPYCPSCGAREAELLGWLQDSRWFAGIHLSQSLPGGGLYRCAHCRLKFRFPTGTPEIYRKLYDNAVTGNWAVDGIRPDWDLIVKKIGALKPTTGRILDFGCYTGGLLSRLDKRYDRFGVEINSSAADTAARLSDARIWPGMESIPADLRFDVIVLSDVIEHVHNPSELIDRLAHLLAEDGVIIITTGDAENPLWNVFGANWWYCFYPEHISFISRAWVENALLPRGWSSLSHEYFSYRHLDMPRKALELILASAYGLLPGLYLRTASALKRLLKRGTVTSVPGNGASADHLLIALTRKEFQ